MEVFTALLISSNKNLIRLITDKFVTNGAEVQTTNERKDLTRKIQRIQPDILIVDANTEKIEAVSICEDLKKRFSHIPQVVLTKSKDLAHVTKFVNIPVEDFLPKPINPGILYARTRSVLQKGLSQKDVLKNGKLRIDENKKKVFYDEKEIDLTPKEYRLLRYMLVNKGQVLNRESILNHVWGYDSYVVDRNVDVYVGYLRKKLKDKKNQDYIKTVPTFGYLMKDLDK